MTRRGFTLLEVSVALVVMGLVVSLAYGALQAGLDTEERLEAHTSSAESGIAVRALLGDAIRHASPGILGGAAVFDLADRSDAGGVPNDSLRFISRGLLHPFGATAEWSVSVFLRDGSLTMVARPLVAPEAGAGVVGGFTALVPGVVALDVRALGRRAASGWLSTWPDPAVAPEAVGLTLGPGTTVASPWLVARRGLERIP